VTLDGRKRRLGLRVLAGRGEGEEPRIAISEQDGVRALHLGDERVQSAMRLADPNALELAYTRAMMAFLLFVPHPREVLMIGLGGGSLAKFIHHRLPGVHTTVVELYPRVVAAARSFFYLPEDDERLKVQLGDGADYARSHPGAADALLVDAFDARCPAPALADASFLADARDALRAGGVLVLNLLGDDPALPRHLKRLEAAFGTRPLCLQPEPGSNVVALALRDAPARLRWEVLKRRGQALEQALGLPFGAFVRALRQSSNPAGRALKFSEE
jgi:spermidine synthase